ncbi:MAG TPA: hypothetical protein DIT25_02150 [Candidatus Moranbacteria bacterium]|nr:hypothetical protein [Candidatus Moranbacteria bacterium]
MIAFIICKKAINCGRSVIKKEEKILMKEKVKVKPPKGNERKKPVRKIKEEKRMAERLQEQHEVTITVVSEEDNFPKESQFYHYSKDLSASGAKIYGNMLLPVDTLVKMDLTLENLHQKISALGKVKWIKVIVEDKSYEAGVEFVDTPDKAIQKIEDYVSWKQQYKNLNPIGMPFWIFAKFNKTK